MNSNNLASDDVDIVPSFRKVATLEDVLGGPNLDRENHPFFYKPSTIMRFDDENKSIYVVSVPVFLAGESFLRYLSHSHNFNNQKQGIFGVVADWKIIWPSTEAERALKKIHSRLEPFWSQFLYHAPHFMHALQDKSKFESDRLTNDAELLEKLGAYAVPKSKYLANIKERAMKGDPYVIEAAILANRSSWNGKRKKTINRLIKRVLDNNGTVTEEVDRALDFNLKGFIVNMRKSGRLNEVLYDLENKKVHLSSIYGYSIMSQITSEGTLKLEKGSIVREFALGEDGALLMSPKNEDQKLGYLMPVIAWSNDGNNREYYAKDLPANIRRLLDINANTLTGLLAALQLQPEVRYKVPLTLGISGSPKKQLIGEAQIPLMALMMQKSIVNGGLLESIEQYTRK